MPEGRESCAPDSGMLLRIANENEITEPHAPLPEDTQSRPAVPPRRRARPPATPPPGLLRDVWPWLALLGVLAVAGLLVWLFVLNRDSGGGTVVPAVVGLQQQQAIARLTGDGFNVRALVKPSRKPRGTVFAQTPGGGSRLDRGETVEIEVSNGRAVTAPPPTTTTATTTKQTTTAAAPTTVSVPSVTGQTAPAGAGQVEAAGLVAETAPVDTPGMPGAIVAQDPAPGADADAGSVVRLSIASGSERPQRQVPNVVGQSAAAARAALLGAKLTVRTEYRKGRRGVVLAQTPAAGSAEPAWTQVTIAVGR